MLNIAKLGDYFYGLQTFLEFCEKCFGPKGRAVLLKQSNDKDYKLSKDSRTIFQQIGSSSNNPLVKTVINFALEQCSSHRDHGLYVAIVALNTYFRLTTETIPVSQMILELNELQEIIDCQMTRQSCFQNLFEPNFETLIQLCTNLITPKLIGYSTSKIGSFSKFLVAALMQSMPNPSSMELNHWLEPRVLLLPVVSIDTYNIGEIFEGLLFPLTNIAKIKKYLQRVVEFRGFSTFEMLYSESKKIKALLMNYDKLKFREMDSDKPIIDVIEDRFIAVLERSNIGVLLSNNEISRSLKLKLFESTIFVVDSMSKRDMVYISRAYNVEVITSLAIEDVEAYIFQIEIPTIRHFHNHSYLAISRSGIVVLIFYVILDSNSNIDETLASFVFKVLSELIFKFHASQNMTVKHEMLCHGAGCTEMILAGIILRISDNDRGNPSFWSPTNTLFIHNTVKQSFANSLIKVWQLVHDFGENKKLFNESIGPLNFCRNNQSCVCSGTRSMFEAGNSYVSDITEAKCSAIKKVFGLLNVLLRTDAIMLVE